MTAIAARGGGGAAGSAVVGGYTVVSRVVLDMELQSFLASRPRIRVECGGMFNDTPFGRVLPPTPDPASTFHGTISDGRPSNTRHQTRKEDSKTWSFELQGRPKADNVVSTDRRPCTSRICFLARLYAAAQNNSPWRASSASLGLKTGPRPGAPVTRGH